MTHKLGKARPLSFSTEMIRAILDGRKTQTRRPMKVQPEWRNTFWVYQDKVLISDASMQSHLFHDVDCPYGEVYEDIANCLWVKETWRVGAWDENEGLIGFEFRAGDQVDYNWAQPAEHIFERLWIQSGDDAEAKTVEPDEDGQYHWEFGQAPTRWRSSRFMPKCASRIVLEITDIRVESLQAITEKDAKAEGSPRDDYVAKGGHRVWFKRLWNSINENRGLGWETNPWVWVIGFKVVHRADEEQATVSTRVKQVKSE